MRKAVTLVVTVLAAMAFVIANAADVEGDWSLYLNAAEGFTTVSMSISVDGEKATATSGTSELSGSYKDGKLKLTGKLYLSDAGYESNAEMEVQLQGEKLKGEMNWDSYSATVDGTRQ